MGSPYPWRYTLRWPYFFVRPSTRKHTPLPPAPPSVDLDELAREPTCRLLFFGDLMCMKHDRVPAVHPKLRELLAGADLVVGNCEAPVTRASSRGDATYVIAFKMSRDFVREFLSALGVPPRRCVLSIANNHIGDEGEAGLEATLEHLAAIGVTVIGHVPGDRSPLVPVDLNGLSLGLAAWTNWLNRDVFRTIPGVWRTREMRDQPWRELKAERGIDCLIGTPHWEYEFQHYPMPETRTLAHHLMDRGFDLLVGHHPHVLQPLEWSGPRLCLYSIGNLNGPPLPYFSWPLKLVSLLEVKVVRAGPRRGRIAGYRLHLFAQHIVGATVSLVPLHEASPPLRDRLAQRVGLLFSEGAG